MLFVDSIADCPSLLCEELDLETKNDQGRMRRRGEGEEEVFNQREDEEPGEEAEREVKEGEEKGKERKVSERQLMVTEGEEEEQVKPESRLEVEEEQEVQMEDNGFEKNKETIADKQQSREAKSLEEKDEQKKSRKRRGKKQNERAKSRRGVKMSYRIGEEKHNQIQEVSTISSEESSTLSEHSFGLMNSSDLSEPIYLGSGGTGVYCPPVPIPLLYSQPPIPIQPAPPQPHGTKRPHSPLLPHSLAQQGPQPLEVRVHFVTVYHSLACLMICEHIK